MNVFNKKLTVQGTLQSVSPRAARCDFVLCNGDTITVQFGAGTCFAVVRNADGVDQDMV